MAETAGAGGVAADRLHGPLVGAFAGRREAARGAGMLLKETGFDVLREEANTADGMVRGK